MHGQSIAATVVARYLLFAMRRGCRKLLLTATTPILDKLCKPWPVGFLQVPSFVLQTVQRCCYHLWLNYQIRNFFPDFAGCEYIILYGGQISRTKNAADLPVEFSALCRLPAPASLSRILLGSKTSQQFPSQSGQILFWKKLK